MKTVVKKSSYKKVMAMKSAKNQYPLRPALFWRFLMKSLGKKDLKDTNFTYTQTGMEKLAKDQPCLILMNHSCFMDLEIAEAIFFHSSKSII